VVVAHRAIIDLKSMTPGQERLRQRLYLAGHMFTPPEGGMPDGDRDVSKP
jgi:hypothetical protein